jgi:hypothetical protein
MARAFTRAAARFLRGEERARAWSERRAGPSWFGPIGEPLWVWRSSDGCRGLDGRRSDDRTKRRDNPDEHDCGALLFRHHPRRCDTTLNYLATSARADPQAQALLKTAISCEGRPRDSRTLWHWAPLTLVPSIPRPGTPRRLARPPPPWAAAFPPSG